MMLQIWSSCIHMNGIREDSVTWIQITLSSCYYTSNFYIFVQLSLQHLIMHCQLLFRIPDVAMYVHNHNGTTTTICKGDSNLNMMAPIHVYDLFIIYISIKTYQ